MLDDVNGSIVKMKYYCNTILNYLTALEFICCTAFLQKVFVKKESMVAEGFENTSDKI